MFFLGPLLGGFIGLIIGGLIGLPFLGMIIGAAMGTSGRGAYNTRKRGSFWGNDFGAQTRASEAFFESIFSMLGKITSADGEVSSQEKMVIRDFMVNQLGLSPQSQQAAMEYFNIAVSDRTRSFDYWARNLYNHYQSRPAILELAFGVLHQVASADGSFTQSEKAMLDSARTIFGLSEGGRGHNEGYGKRRFEEGSRSTRGELDVAYSELGCSPSSSDDEIKKIYRKKVNEFHPDKIEAKGLPPEFTQFAKEKFQSIQNSYDIIKRARNLS